MPLNVPVTREMLENSPYVARNAMGDALEQSGLSAVTSKGTFPYPEAINLRRTPSLSGMQISMLPFQHMNHTAHAQVPRHTAIGSSNIG